MENIQISLKAARYNAGLKIVDAAAKIGISPSTLIKWEANPEIVTPEKQRIISEVYNFPIDNIIFLTRK